MPTVRIIPCLDIRDGRVVKGVNFVGIRDVGDPVELAHRYGNEGADELVFLDITASTEARVPVVELAERVAEQIFIPFTVGGGIRHVETIRDCLRAGADKVSLNTSVIQRPQLISEAAERFGSQCIVVAIDAKRNPTGGWSVYTHGGRNVTELDAVEWASTVAQLGAGELLVTSMDGDGTQTGYDNALYAAIAQVTNIPLIASGGAGTTQHMIDAIQHGRADAVLLASLLHDGLLTISQIKTDLSLAGISVRS